MRSEEKAREILEKAVKISPAEETQAILYSSSFRLTRFANNTIHQNMEEEETVLSVRAVHGKRTARATTNKLSEDGVKEVVETASRLARLAPEDPHLPEMPGPQRYETVDRHDPATAECDPAERAQGVETAVKRAERHRLTAAGYFSTQETVTAMANSRGLFAFFPSTGAEFSLTVMAGDPASGGGSGWAKEASPAVADIALEALVEKAITKALEGKNPKEVEPGAYAVILEPSAVVDLLSFLIGDFSGLSVLEQRSCLTGKVGTRLFGQEITIADDVVHPLQSGLPFDGEGIPRQKVMLVEKGLVKNLVSSLATAMRMGVQPTGHGYPLPTQVGEAPENIVMEGGDATVEEMIASTERGLLITRFWYIREVDPMAKILTGMTRDGTFAIEKGRITHAVKNLRFNESLVEMLKRVEMIGRPVRACGEEYHTFLIVPPLKVSAFHFTARTRF